MLPITFLSDYGHEDEFVGVCHGVIAAHRARGDGDRPRPRVAAARRGLGARALRNALPYLPLGVHLAVVDPGVGTVAAPARRCAARTAATSWAPTTACCGPRSRRAGASTLAVDIDESPHRLEPVSATFHGRDLFAPVAAALALGAPLEEAGEPVAPDTLVPLDSRSRPY